MAGIYIHIPFCRQACHYCNFHFTTSLRNKQDLTAAILEEINLQQQYLEGEVIETIYLGGGTPSLLSDKELVSILHRLREVHTINNNAELTLEANPDDIDKEKLTAWKAAGINRLSIGVQSFFDEDLVWMNRAHNELQAYESLQLATSMFANITLDLIYGSPILTDKRWKQNVDRAIQLGVPHLSCYALTVEPKTPLEKLIRLQKRLPVDPEKQSSQFLLLMEWMNASGYEHYEISNFSKPGWKSKHNSSYWSGEKYLGLGPSAHSYNGKERQWNISNNSNYIDAVKSGIVPFEKEVLTPLQQLNEYIMTALRTSEGIDLEKLETVFHQNPALFIRSAKKYMEEGLLLQENRRLQLTQNGKLFADGIAAALFF